MLVLSIFLPLWILLIQISDSMKKYHPVKCTRSTTCCQFPKVKCEFCTYNINNQI